MSQKLITSSANSGMGLWTTICYSLCMIFGKESKALLKKQQKVLDLANAKLEYQINSMKPRYRVVDYSVSWSTNLAVTVCALMAEVEEESADSGKNSADQKQKIIHTADQKQKIIHTADDKEIMMMVVAYLNRGLAVNDVADILRKKNKPILSGLADEISQTQDSEEAAIIAKRFMDRYQ